MAAGERLRHRQPKLGPNTDQPERVAGTQHGEQAQQNGWHRVAEQMQTSDGTETEYKTAHEYAQAVQRWMWQYQWYNSLNYLYMSTFPMYAMNMLATQQSATSQQGGQASGDMATPGPVQTPPPNQVVHQPAADQFQNQRDREFKIPTLWKRVMAEFMDFVLLFLIKLGVTILTVEYVGMDIQKYDLDVLLSQNLDYDAAFALTSELIAMEIINRIFICLFETLCLRKGVGGQIGGTTPGKRLMGLRVISVQEIIELPNHHVRITPAGDIGIWNALVRSVIKNFSLAFFFPVCFTVFFFQHNRAAYDIIANCMVVELTDTDLALGR